MIQKQEYVSQLTANEWSPEEKSLMDFIFENQVEKLKYLVASSKMEAGKKPAQINYLIEFKHISLDKFITPLILACYLGRLEIIKFLAKEYEISYNLASSPNGFTPLQVACFSGFYEIAKLLVIQPQIDVNQKNNTGQSALWYCF